MKLLKTPLLVVVAVFALAAPMVSAAPSTGAASTVTYDAKFDEKIRKELVTLPFFGVFDNLAFRREGSTVTLYGQVIRPTTRSGAEARIGRLDGVERVINRIEVLPLSRFDDEIRAHYRAVSARALYRYSMAHIRRSTSSSTGAYTLEAWWLTEGAQLATRGPGVPEHSLDEQPAHRKRWP